MLGMKEIIVGVAKGNPGALQFIMGLAKLENGTEAVLTMRAHNICGEDAYKLWNDCCSRNEEEAAKILQLLGQGKLTDEEVFEHIRKPRGITFDLAELLARKPAGGYLQRRYGMMMLKKVPEGTCEMCAVAHDPAMPHNRNSLAYQYKFYDQHGRFPTWRDAMVHCTPQMQQDWIRALQEKGVDVDQ